jgi:flagellin
MRTPLYKEVEALRINTNISALNAWKNLAITDGLMTKSLEKLSSGYRINRAADDAAGLAISEKMKAQTTGLRQAVRNAQDGISLIQTAEGALSETHAILQRMRELMVQAGNGIYDSEDLSKIKEEMDQLIDEIDGIAQRTEFNGKNLLNAGQTINLQIGANGGQSMTIVIGQMDAATLGVAKTNINVTGFVTDPTDPLSFDSQLGAIDTAISTVSSTRSQLGAYQNRLEHTINNLNTAAENLEAAGSRIRDVDMALEMANFTRHQILQQAGTAMLAQANLTPQSILKLLG